MVVVLKIRGSLERNEPAPGREARGKPTGLPDTGGAGFPGCSSEEVRAVLFLWFRNYCCSDARRFPAERIITRNGKTFNFLANSTVFWGSVLGSAFCRKKGSRSLGTHRSVRAVTPLTDGMCTETLLQVADQPRLIDSSGTRRGLRGQRRDVILTQVPLRREDVGVGEASLRDMPKGA